MGRQWYNHNLRFLQTVLREPDITDYDAKAVVSYMKETDTNCLVVNAGGVIDFFESPLDMSNPNRFMKRDILGDICGEVHAAGLRVLTRVDFRGVEPRRYKMHPDWFSYDQYGSPKTSDLGNVTIARPCYHSYYTGTHAPTFVDYIMKTYDIDGIWQNALGFDVGVCYCKNCREAYFNDTGLEIPPLPPNAQGRALYEAAGAPGFGSYRAWKAGCADRHIESMRAVVKKYGEDKVYCAEIFSMYNASFTMMTGIDHYNAKKSFDFIISAVFLDSSHSGQGGAYDHINASASTIRFSRALDPSKQPVICTGGNGTRWRYIKAPAFETRLWLWEIASVGGGIWNCYFNGICPSKTHDRRNAFSEKPVYAYLAENTDILSDTVPVMDAAIYYSAPSRDIFSSPDEGRDGFGVHIKGVERVLLENHIQYNFLPDSGFTRESLKGVKALLLPNAVLLSDDEMDIIREYVSEGGGLIATYRTSLCDENGAARGGFGLSDVFGVSYTGVEADTENDTYQLIIDKNSPVLVGTGDTDVLMNGGKTLICRPANQDYDTVATHIPTIPNQPPEYAWIPDMRTEYPTIIAGRYGEGRVVYFANKTDALCYLNGHEDYTGTYKNALDFVSGGDYSVLAEAPRSVHINAIVQQTDPGHMVISFVNASGAQQRPIKENVPVFGATAGIPLKGRKLARSNVLHGDCIDIQDHDGCVKITIGRLDEFAAVEIKLK